MNISLGETSVSTCKDNHWLHKVVHGLQYSSRSCSLNMWVGDGGGGGVLTSDGILPCFNQIRILNCKINEIEGGQVSIAISGAGDYL